MKHYPTRLHIVQTYDDGAVRVRFDCTRACGMTDDETVGDDLTAARAAAARICSEHRVSFEARVSRAVTR